MNKYLKGLILAVVVVLLSLALAQFFGEIYKLIIRRPVSGSFWGPDPIWFAGLTISFAFFVTFILSIFGGVNKYKIMVALVFLEVLVFLGSNGFVFIIATALIGWLLGEGILKLSKSLKK